MGGPSGWPVTCANPLMASARVPKPGRSLAGPPPPYPLTWSMTRLRMGPVHRFVVEAPAEQRARSIVGHQDVADVEKAVEQILPFGMAEVEGHALLVAADALPEQPDPILHGSPGAHRVAGPRLLDLDHLGPELPQRRRHHRPGGERRRVDDPQPVEWSDRVIHHVLTGAGQARDARGASSRCSGPGTGPGAAARAPPGARRPRRRPANAWRR